MKTSNLITALALGVVAYGIPVADDPANKELLPAGKNPPVPYLISQTASEYVKARTLGPQRRLIRLVLGTLLPSTCPVSSLVQGQCVMMTEKARQTSSG